MRMLHAVALQRSQIIAVAQLAEQIFQNVQVPLPAGGAEFQSKGTLEVALNRVVVAQGVIDTDEEDAPPRYGHTDSCTLDLFLPSPLPSRHSIFGRRPPRGRGPGGEGAAN